MHCEDVANDKCGCAEDCVSEHRQLADWLKELQRYQWIPCSERLPSNFNEDKEVLATTDVDGHRVVLMLAVDVERFYLKGYVSAWMPLPKPYEPQENN